MSGAGYAEINTVYSNESIAWWRPVCNLKMSMCKVGTVTDVSTGQIYLCFLRIREMKGRNLIIERVTSGPGFILCPWHRTVNRYKKKHVK